MKVFENGNIREATPSEVVDINALGGGVQINGSLLKR